MPNESEQKALSQIKAYLDAGHSLDAIRQSGWGDWIELLETKGYDLRTGQLALRPPEGTPVPGPIPASDEGTQATAATGTPLTADTKGGPFELVAKPMRAWWTWSLERKGWAKAAAFGIPLLAVVILVSALSSVIGGNDESTGGRASSYSVLEQSEVVFEGGYSKVEIKRVLDRAMTLYGLSITERNYDRATNMLVAFRQDYGVREMDILNVMIRSHVPGLNVTFVDAAGIATAVLASGAD